MSSGLGCESLKKEAGGIVDSVFVGWHLERVPLGDGFFSKKRVMRDAGNQGNVTQNKVFLAYVCRADVIASSLHKLETCQIQSCHW